MIQLKRTEDANMIATLNRAVHERHIQLAPDFFTPYNHQAIQTIIAERMKQDSHYFFIAEIDDTVIGYVWFEERVAMANAFRQAVRTLYVHQISIEPNVKRQGYGSLLMEEIERWAMMRGFKSVELDYWTANEEAAAFYDRIGFQAKRQVVVKYL